MAHATWPRALLVWLALALGIKVSINNDQDHNNPHGPLRQLQPAESAVACPSASSAIANATKPVLTTACPADCGADNLCVYYPRGFVTDCASRTCVRGGACAFECLPSTTAALGWFLTLYDDPAVVDAVNTQNFLNTVTRPDYRSVAVNASLVGEWIGKFTFPTDQMALFITGNEPANNMPMDSEPRIQDVAPLQKGATVPFKLPSSFFRDVQGFLAFRLENVPFPTTEANVSAALAFPSLDTLVLRNTMLTSFPFAKTSFSVLDMLDLSVNFISEIAPSGFPDTITYLNLSFNEISQLTKDSIPRNLSVLDIRNNPTKTITAGALPPGLQQLFLTDNQLTKIPADVSGMQGLTTLYLDSNALQEIPDNAIPPGRLEMLNLENCSLTAVPKALKAMTRLRKLWMDRNDFSRDPDFSVLPLSLITLGLNNCNLQKLPIELKNLSSLNVLDLEYNPKVVADLSALPAKLQYLYLGGNALDVVPPEMKRLGLDTLFLNNNPLSRFLPGSLPATLNFVMFTNTTFLTLPSGSLPQNLGQLAIIDSALEELPTDVRTMQQLTILELSNCRLTAFDEGDAFRNLDLLTLNQNRLTSFSGSYPTLTQLTLQNNALALFRISNALALRSLDLSQNNLTTFPDSVFQLPKLQVLNLAGNPIRNFLPSTDQVEFLGRIPSLTLEQGMFATECERADRVALNGYVVCTQTGTKHGANKSWMWLVPLNVGLALVLALSIFTFWRRRKVQRQRLDDLAVEAASLENQQRNQSTVSIWTDAVLIKHRLDEDLVKRERLLGRGMFGEVWLATYKQDKVAVKQLRGSESHGSRDVDRETINDFVREIKLMSTLTHANVVQLIGAVWTKETDIAMVIEYMNGGDLRAYLDNTPKEDSGGWTAPMVRVALQITEAIGYLHSLAPVVIHRDLKSRNVLLDTTMCAKLSDFGVSRYKLDDRTMTAGVGTVRWVAPEVLAGQQYDESVDVYSLGIILSEVDTHRLPYDDLTDDGGQDPLTDSAVAGMIVTGALKVKVTQSCPSSIRSLVQRCTAFKPQQRPSVFQVADELRAVLDYSTSRGGVPCS